MNPYFVLQSQLLTPLTPLITILNQRLSSWRHQPLRRITKLNKELEDSLNQACKSLRELIDGGFLASPNLVNLKSTQDVLHLLQGNKSSRLPWLESYTSSASFEQNKRSTRLFSHPSLVLIQTRGFRSRSNPSVGIGSEPALRDFDSNARPTEVSEGRREALGSIFGSESKPISLKLTEGQKESLRQLLSKESSLSLKDQQRLKVAFAEGYLAANPKDGKTEKSKTLRWLSAIKDMVAFTIMLVILMSVLESSVGGPFKRALIGGGHEVHPEEIDVSFHDVKGVAEAKQELQEVVEFLKNPDKFSHLGGKLPKGVLLVGPPGTGKTLLARAVAGEAGVPFFHASGPEFDEVFVGQGARRVRDLFAQAKLRAPCVVFIDEIDSVGQKRTNSVVHPYANQTINQLLTEMDGFKQNEGVVVIGATNRREDLDKALLRPGRFDVEVPVPPPDLKGREELFEYYLSKIKKGSDVVADILAKRTTGFTGADIENMINQAALRAAIDGASSVSMTHMEYSRDKVIMGPAKKNRIPDEEANRITAFHEGGHTIVSYFTKEALPLHKVTIISRGQSLGHTAFIPEKEMYHTTKAQMLARLDVSMGGRAAEEVVFGSEKVTSGAFSDLSEATQIATQMVKMYGMSDKVGLRTFNDPAENKDLSAATTDAIDLEIKRILQVSFSRLVGHV